MGSPACGAGARGLSSSTGEEELQEAKVSSADSGSYGLAGLQSFSLW